jgi:hypothetical protein
MPMGAQFLGFCRRWCQNASRIRPPWGKKNARLMGRALFIFNGLKV